MGSKPFFLDGTDLGKIAKGALYATVSVLIAIGAEQLIPAIDQSAEVGAIAAGIAGVLLTAARRWVTNYAGTK